MCKVTFKTHGKYSNKMWIKNKKKQLLHTLLIVLKIFVILQPLFKAGPIAQLVRAADS